MNKGRIILAVWVTALTVVALGAVPIQSAAQVNTYDKSFDDIAQRHGYYRALASAATADFEAQAGSNLAQDSAADAARWAALGRYWTYVDADGDSLTFDQLARRHGYYRALLAATGADVASIQETALNDEP